MTKKYRLSAAYKTFLFYSTVKRPCIIHDPKGIYYGGTIAAPVVRSIFENVLPYLGIKKTAVKTQEDNS